MNIFKSFILGISFVSLLTSVTFAQTPASPSTTQPGIVISTLNIQNAKILDQVGNIIHLSFNITNREILQSGVKYGVRLVSETKTNRTTIDEYVYDDVLTIAPNSSLEKDIVYKAPTNLSGTYTLMIISNNVSGFPFGSTKVGKVTLTASDKGLLIAPETCFVSLAQLPNAPKHSLSENVSIMGYEALELTCSATNQLNTNISLLPSFETRYRSVSGEVVNAEGGDTHSIDFKAKEKKNFSVLLPKAATAQSYVVSVNFANGGVSSNKINVNYTIGGVSGTIFKLSADKDYYQRKDIALVSTLIAPSGVGEEPLSLSLKIKDDKGRMCARGITETIEKDVGSKIDTSFEIKRNCFNPTVSAKLSTSEGVVLDEKDFKIETTSVARPKESFVSRYFVPIIILVMLVIAGLSIYMKKKNAPKVILPLLVFIVSLGFFSSSSAYADVYYIGGPNGYVLTTVNIDNSSYTPGNPIPSYGPNVPITITTAEITYSSSGSLPLSVNLTAEEVFSSVQQTLLGFANINPGDTRSQLPTALGNTPNAAGTNYSVLFTTGVDEDVAPPPPSCSAVLRFAGSFRWGRVIYIGPSTHQAITATVTLVGNVSPGSTVGERTMQFYIPPNSNHSFYNNVDCQNHGGEGCEIEGTGGFDHGYVSGSSTNFACGDQNQYYTACFIADTQVLLANGTSKNIQDIKIGDILKGETTNNKVLGFHRPNLDGKLYSFNGGRYFVTEEHPFKTTNGWKSINPEKTALENIGITVTKLEVGDILITENGLTKINSIDGKDESPDTPLYNFMLDGDHTYYADGYLVHNKQYCDEVTSCGSNIPCIDSNNVGGYRFTPPPPGTCATGCWFPNGQQLPFCPTSGYGAKYCPNSAGACQ